jgi:hypothetical protein
MLETETARLLPRGSWEFHANYEHQVSSEGTEAAIPFAVEYGIRDRLEFLIEPVVYTAIRPDVGPDATGVGDLEVTLTYGLRAERAQTPALALAEEVKIPTATNALIGTQEPDYATYLIASKRLGAVDLHAQLAYTFTGQPTESGLNNTASFGVAAVLRPEARLSWFAEVLGSTATSPEAMSNNESSQVPETGGAELSGTFGASAVVRSDLRLHLSVTYDNSNAVLIRPGLTLRFP